MTRLCVVSALIWTLGSAVPVQAAGGLESPRSVENPDTAPVVVSGVERFKVTGISSYSAKRRATEIAARIEALAGDPKFSGEALQVIAADDYHAIVTAAESKPVLRVFDLDADLEGIKRNLLAEVLRKRIVEAIEEYRHDHRPDVLIKHSLYALGSVAAMAAVLALVFWCFRRLNDYLEPRVTRQIQELETKTKRIFQGGQFWGMIRSLLQLLRVVIILVVLYLGTNFSLSLFAETRYFARQLFHLVLVPLREMGEAFIAFIPDFIFLLILFLVTRYILKLTKGFFAAIQYGRLRFENFEAEWAMPTYRIVRLVIGIIALVIAYPFIPGTESTAFKGVSVLVGVLFSLGSTSVISNVIAGYTMTYRRAFKIGHRVKIGDVVGDVTEMRVLVTHVRTPKNEEVVIPNSTILNNEIVNYSSLAKEHGLILHTTVGIGYEVPWRQVEAMLLLAADKTAGLLKEPKPFVRQMSLADFAVVYEINAYCDDAAKMQPLLTAMHRNIQDVFNENGVQIMTPAYEGDPVEAKVVPKEKWHTPLVGGPDQG